MKIVFCGLAITSSWGNGHATTYRALIRALNARGHKVIFFERDLEWYASSLLCIELINVEVEGRKSNAVMVAPSEGLSNA